MPAYKPETTAARSAAAGNGVRAFCKAKPQAGADSFRPSQIKSSGLPPGSPGGKGYGLDYCQQYRNVPYIGVLKPEVYSEQ